MRNLTINKKRVLDCLFKFFTISISIVAENERSNAKSTWGFINSRRQEQSKIKVSQVKMINNYTNLLKFEKKRKINKVNERLCYKENTGT